MSFEFLGIGDALGALGLRGSEAGDEGSGDGTGRGGNGVVAPAARGLGVRRARRVRNSVRRVPGVGARVPTSVRRRVRTSHVRERKRGEKWRIVGN